MKPLYLILALLAVLVINNLVLLNFVGYFDQETSSVLAPAPNQDAETEVQNKIVREVVAQNEPEIVVSNVPEEPVVQSFGNVRFVESFQRLADSKDFDDVMDRWQLRAQKRYREIGQRVTSMSTEELFEMANSSDSMYESNSAFQQLMQGSMNKLSSEQLKSLYNNENTGSWGKSSLIEALLDKDDPQGLAWAKEMLQAGGVRNYMGSDILARVYEKDPEFINRHLDKVNLDSRYGVYGVVSLLRQESELAETYMKKHFDRFLDSDNRWINEVGLNSIEFELSDDHEQKLLAMMNDESRRKRKFSLGFVHRIKDVDGLRSAFTSLQSNREKKDFVSSLISKNASSERRQLAKELAIETGDEALMESIK